MCAHPRSFSQLITSFFASESLGIPHTPLFCLLYLRVLAPKDKNLCSFYFLNIFLSQYVNERFQLSPIVENIGVEPMTSCVQGRRSSQLS
jgi:hypothetical protein